MGDPKSIRKKYETPRHPWIGSRIKEEKQLLFKYGLRNKREAWRMVTVLKEFKDRAKKLLAFSDEQALKEQQQLLERLTRLGLIKKGATFDDILGLEVESVMERRLQTLLIKRNLARTPKQARQMITHRHVIVGGKVITSPGMLVTVDDESTIQFAARSDFSNEAHPERFSEEELARKKAKDEAKKQRPKGSEEESAATFDPAAIEQAEVLAGEKKVDSVKEAVSKEKQEKEAPKATPEKPAEKVESEKLVEKESSKAELAEKAENAKKSDEKSEQTAPAKTEEAPAKEKAEKSPDKKEEDA